MQIGMIGLGRMGANMVRRLLAAGHEAVVHDRVPAAAAELAPVGARAAASLADLVAQLAPPRHLFVMVPAAAVGSVVAQLADLLAPDDVVVDGGNSHFADAIARAESLATRGIRFVDMGTSGGVFGLERGYCLMLGGEAPVIARLEPALRALAPGRGAIAPSPARAGRGGTAEEGYLHCGSAGAGHFVKMVHNGIEYGLMAAYAEGFNLLARAGAGRTDRPADAETPPLAHPERYQFDFDLAEIAELWRRGSVIPSWLLDLTADALAAEPRLESYGGRVSDSGEGRWTVEAAVELGVPAHVLAAALFERFSSRDQGRFQNQVLSAMRHGFGGHVERPGR